MRLTTKKAWTIVLSMEILDQNKKHSKSSYSILDKLECSKKPSHATVPLMNIRVAHFFKDL